MLLTKIHILDFKLIMPYKILIIHTLMISFMFPQSLFNLWSGTDPFVGSAKSSSMGQTHILNSEGSSTIRFNPANIKFNSTKPILNFQINQYSIFEKWSIPIRDSFGEFLVNADYVSNEFSKYGISIGTLIPINKILKYGQIGLYHGPLTHFTYNYSEEVRGNYDAQDGEYVSKDPLIGYQNLNIDGEIMMSTLGGGFEIYSNENINLSFGLSASYIYSSDITHSVSIDTLSTNLENLSSVNDIENIYITPSSYFNTLSSNIKLFSNLTIALSLESKAHIQTETFSMLVDSTNGLFQYWKNNDFAIDGINYQKPLFYGIAASFNNPRNNLNINFEIDQISYKDFYLSDYSIYKFGFEYTTDLGKPIRSGLVYKTSPISYIQPISIFTFGSALSIGNYILDLSGTYEYITYNYPDLFTVENDLRNEYDIVRDSQLNLILAFSYLF